MIASLPQFAGAIAEVILPVLYAVTTVAYGYAFLRADDVIERWKSRLLYGTVLLHFLYVGQHSAQFGRCMVTTPFEIMSLIAFTITATYAIIEYRTGIRGTGFFILVLATLLELVSSIVVKLPSSGEINPVLSELGIGLHISFAIFGYAGFGIAAVYSLLYLWLYRDLKRGSFGSVYSNLPSLESLESLAVVASVIGFVFLTVSMLIGVVWLPRAFENYSYLDPKLISTALTWLLYASVLVARFMLRIDGKRIVTLALGGFVFALLSMTVVNAFLSNFHRFM